MGHSFYAVGDHTYFVVPSTDPDGFVIIDLEYGSEVVDGDGEVVDGQTSRWPCYSTEHEAEEAILRWKRTEDDREGLQRVIRLFEEYERARVEALPKR